MRFIVDACTGPGVARWLEQQGHEVFSVHDEQAAMDDDAIIAKADTEEWILVTNDKDFGEKVFRQRQTHHGIILMRLADERVKNKIAVLQSLLSQYGAQIAGNYIVVTEGTIRFAKPLP